jgi:hypothetical protein
LLVDTGDINNALKSHFSSIGQDRNKIFQCEVEDFVSKIDQNLVFSIGLHRVFASVRNLAPYPKNSDNFLTDFDLPIDSFAASATIVFHVSHVFFLCRGICLLFPGFLPKNSPIVSSS